MRTKIRTLVFVSLAASLLAVCSFLTVPAPVPFTLQTFAVHFAVLFLGWRYALLAISLYLALGAVGVPVFAGFSAGIGHLFGPTGGYLIAFLLIPLVFLAAAPLIKRRRGMKVLALALGQLLCYLVGSVWFVLVMQNGGSAVGFGEALTLCVLPYLLPDAAKLALAVLLDARLRKMIPPIS